MNVETKYRGEAARFCPVKGCRYRYLYLPGTGDENNAEEALRDHFEREHCGTARVRVVLETKVRLLPGETAGDAAARQNDRFQNERVAGYELAYTVGEVTEAADDHHPDLD